ncbi:prominin-1-A-like [Pecten maximus]|uniref:prominin-1-A-like n=1 Tax=Pecten maximus TaxID=6579 RepID=UPI001457EEAB|nr:prominin-1-A-like [Pecten maximus]
MTVYIALLWCVFLCSLSPGNGVGQFSLPPLPPQPSFKAAGITYDDAGMGPLFDFARSFVDTSLSAGFPTQLIKDITNGNISFDMDMIKQLLLDYIGYAIAVVLGILFVILFPVIGCCFCCCRNCCRACCDRPKTADPKASCKRKVYGSIFFVLVTFTIVGNACIYVSNGRISTALDKVTGTVTDNLDDFDTFLNSSEKQIEQIKTNFHLTTDEINKLLNSTSFSQTLSEYAVSSLTGGAVQRLQDSAESVKHNIDGIQAELNKPGFTSAITALKVLPGGSGLAPPSVNLPTIDTGILTDVTSSLKSAVGSATGSITAQLNAAKTQVSQLSGQVDSVVDGIKTTIDDAKQSNLDSIKDTVSDTVDTIKPYDKYRWIAGVSIGGIISLIVGLQFFGLGFGVCGSCGSSSEDSKGCMSNSGGRMIIASIIFIFLFSWLLMLLTTLLFSVGALVEKFMCEPLKDPQLTDIESVLDDIVDMNSMLQYQQEPPSLGTILSSCKENKAIYSALQMDKMGNLVDFPALEQQIQSAKTVDKCAKFLKIIKNESGNLKIKTSCKENKAIYSALQMDKMGNLVDFPALEQQIQSAKTNMETQLAGVLAQLTGGNFGSVSLNSAKLDKIKTDIGHMDVAGVESKVTDLQNKVDALARLSGLPAPQHQHILTITASLSVIKQKLVPLKQLKVSIGPMVDDVKNQLTTATSQITGNGEMTRLSNEFINNTFDVVDVFYRSTKNAIYQDLGKCGPIWNLYSSIVIISVCQYTVDALNGFWFSLGWCIFFLVPSIVFGIKLSNLFRDIPSGLQEPKWKNRNKVGHSAEHPFRY